MKKTNTTMKLNLFACKRSVGYCGGLIVVAAHDIDEAYNLYKEYGKKECLVSFYDNGEEVVEDYNEYPRQKWYPIRYITVECDLPRVIDEDGYTE